MVRRVVEVHGLDRRRIYITGLSAGGAMSLVMLATYPELFASGAIIAGLPYGCATSIPEAFDRMRGHGLPSEQELHARVRRASSHQGPWPTLSLWHGSADQTVAHTNMDAIIAQWSGLHGLASVIPEQNSIGVHGQRLWRDKAGVAKIEAFSISGMGHGTPLSGADDIGATGAFMLDARISSTRHIARFWQLTETGSEVSLPNQREAAEPATTNKRFDSNTQAPSWQPVQAAAGVGKVIEDALRAAGLMR